MAAKAEGLEKMSYAELRALRDRVDAAMSESQLTQKKALRSKMEALAAEAGLSLADVLGGRRGMKGAKGPKNAAKYRNPKNPSQVWSGRGRRPTWIAEAIAKGQKIDTFLI